MQDMLRKIISVDKKAKEAVSEAKSERENVEKEKEVQAFKSEEYWEIFLDFKKDGKKYKAKLEKVNNGEVNLKNETDANNGFSVGRDLERYLMRRY